MPVTFVMYASNQSKTNLTEPSYRTLLITLLLHSLTGFAYRFEIPKCKPIYYDNNITRQSLEIDLVHSTVWICECYHQLTPVKSISNKSLGRLQIITPIQHYIVICVVPNVRAFTRSEHVACLRTHAFRLDNKYNS